MILLGSGRPQDRRNLNTLYSCRGRRWVEPVGEPGNILDGRCRCPEIGFHVKFLHLELGIAATVDYHTGPVKLETQFTPTAYIPSPSCHLTSGFAVYYWFPTANPLFSHPELENDRVFTVGRFHWSFTRPTALPKPTASGYLLAS